MKIVKKSAGDKRSVDERLEEELGLEPMALALVPEVMGPLVEFTGNSDQDRQNDMDAARKALHQLSNEATSLAQNAAHFAKERQDPRSIEVAVQAQKEARDSVMAILDYHKTKVDIERAAASPINNDRGGDTINNTTVFCGTTAEIVKMLKDLPKIGDNIGEPKKEG